ncbi:hydrogenase nickel incorporation protein HypB [candidate division KSB1 bacterium]|nr:hydrogenase nickel incorporation protein HypB [candidate division KSB1 bacterium]RQW05459.1 MAG: hydrogenase accessory protein HypB [candidate division KSB1 bacterium]
MMSVVTVERKVLEKNDQVADIIRGQFKRQNIIALNLLSSPGSGKTTLLERTLELLSGHIISAVIEGDVQTDIDAQRIAKHHVPVVQIVTNGGCHLDAMLVRDALAELPLDGVQMLFIENVGNLVCPASYDLGENYKVVIVSTTEGDDKPVKYPKMFRVANVCVLSKIDLLDHVDFDIDRFKAHARMINPDLLFFATSAETGDGFDKWTDWLRQLLKMRSL